MPMPETLLNAVTGDATGTAIQITGDFEISGVGDAAGGMIVLERSIDNVAGNYKPAGRQAMSYGDFHAAIQNTGANWYRARLQGATRVGSGYTLRANQ
jgi:hypothetical protein